MNPSGLGVGSSVETVPDEVRIVPFVPTTQNRLLIDATPVRMFRVGGVCLDQFAPPSVVR